MPTLALALALVAATLHATWNVLLARSGRRATTAIMVLAATIVFAPFAVATWRVPPEAYPYALAAALFELLYFVLLSTAYSRSEMSLVYPLARGLAPLLVFVVSVAVLAAPTTDGELAGVLLVALGIVLVTGLQGRMDARGVAAAAAIGACIAAYTLIDKGGMRYAAPLPYLWLQMLLLAIVLGIGTLRRGPAALVAEIRPSSVFAGIAMFAAYALVLGALSIAPAAPVAAVRETSVVIGAALGALVLKERFGRSRWLGAAVVAAGVALLALG